MAPRINLDWCKHTLRVSFIVYKAGYTQKGVSLYCHIADLAGNSDVILLVLSFSDFTVLLIHALNFEKAMDIGAEAYHTLKNVIKDK
eukprot:bmy_00881T0